MADHRYHMTLHAEGIPRPLDLGWPLSIALGQKLAKGDMKSRGGEPIAAEWASSRSGNGEEWVLSTTCGKYFITTVPGN
jgi:hypothetical protein